MENKIMKIITWNCNGAFRKKYDFLNNFDWDIAVIQECENPAENKEFQKIMERCDSLKYFQWIGENKNKGLAVFSRSFPIEIDKRFSKVSSEFCNYGDSSHELRYFLPLKINGFTIIGCWCHTGDDYIFRYIGQLWKYLLLNSDLIDSNTIFVGDFNANKIWDYEHAWWSFSTVNKILNQKGLYSYYHLATKEDFGKEKQPTFFLHRDKEKSYHIDYVYGNPDFLKEITILKIPKNDEKVLSDHLPIYCELNK